MSGYDADAANKDNMYEAGVNKCYDSEESSTLGRAFNTKVYDSDETTWEAAPTPVQQVDCMVSTKIKGPKNKMLPGLAQLDVEKQNDKAEALGLKQKLLEMKMKLKQEQRNTKAAQQHAKDEADARSKERNEHAKVESSKLGRKAKSDMVSLSVAFILAVLFCY